MSTAKTKIRGTVEERLAFGREFRMARIESGRKQGELADFLDVSPDAISAWERGLSWAPIEAIRKLGAKISPASRQHLFDAAGIEDTDGLLQVRSEARKIDLLQSPDELGQMGATVGRVFTVPSEWFPEEANVKAIRISRSICPVFGSEVFAFVDLARRDPVGLEGHIVIARTPRGNEPMLLRKVGRTFFLAALPENANSELHGLEHDGDWSIVGDVIRWFADAPAPARK